MVMHLKTEDEQEEISTWGIGPKLVLISLPFILFFSFLALYYPIFQFLKNATWMLILGIIWTIFGFICSLISRRTLNLAFRENILITTGIYGYVRHPLYASWILGITPGIIIIIRSWILWAIPVVLYIVFRILIPKEEKNLEDKFNGEYLDYKRKVWRIIPHLKTYKKRKK